VRRRKLQPAGSNGGAYLWSPMSAFDNFLGSVIPFHEQWKARIEPCASPFPEVCSTSAIMARSTK
jgi:hypothetical protein